MIGDCALEIQTKMNGGGRTSVPCFVPMSPVFRTLETVETFVNTRK